MQRREWSVPVRESSQADQSSDASALSQPSGGKEFVSHFILYMVFSGVIGFLLSSWFPVALGLFLFFTDGAFIEWVLGKIGIRLVPDTLGSEFTKAFVFFSGSWILLAFWRESAPEWLLPWLPLSASWYFIAGAALGCGMLQVFSVAVVRNLLPRVGIEITPDRQNWAILVVLGMLIGLIVLAGFISTP
jgi:hypothetical protein